MNDCTHDTLSSRMCERGTKGCDVRHDMSDIPTPIMDDAERALSAFSIRYRPIEQRLLKTGRTLERELTVAQQRIAELEQDKARLDWLLEDTIMRFETTYHDRQAIDNAMKGTS